MLLLNWTGIGSCLSRLSYCGFSLDWRVSANWFDLLLLQRKKGLTGRTLPFLVGACRTPPGSAPANQDDAFFELGRLLEHMRDADPKSHVVRIATCVDLGQPLAALYPRDEPMNQTELVRSRFDGRHALFVERCYRGNGDLNHVLETLWEHLAGHIAAGRYSFRNGAYAPFHEEDLAFIAEANELHTRLHTRG